MNFLKKTIHLLLISHLSLVLGQCWGDQHDLDDGLLLCTWHVLAGLPIDIIQCRCCIGRCYLLVLTRHGVAILVMSIATLSVICLAGVKEVSAQLINHNSLTIKLASMWIFFPANFIHVGMIQYYNIGLISNRIFWYVINDRCLGKLCWSMLYP